MFVFENPHPKGKFVGDCAKRAITLATGREYKEVSTALNRYKKITGAWDYYDYKRNVVPYIVNELGGEKISFPVEQGKSRMDGYSFCKAFPKGRYLLRMAHHLAACVDGVIYDTWDCRDKCVYTAYKLNLK